MGRIVAATLVTGLAWAYLVPPFEGPDESAFYKGLMSYTHGARQTGLPLYAAIMKPALRLAGGRDETFQAVYNPSFRFISNRWGRVNMYMHGRAERMLKGDVNRLYLLRVLTLLMWMVSLLFICETARLFFGRADLALATALFCLAIPQFSFFASRIHEEATSTLLASIAYWAFTARGFGRLGRWPTWVIAIATMALAPFSDRQAYFLMPLVPFGLVVTERTRRGAMIAAGVLLVPVALMATSSRFLMMQRDVQTWLAPFLPGYRSGWWNHDTWQYLTFEFAPKMFFGFWGWIGQPSILLPPPLYAGFAVLSALAIAGLCLRSAREALTPEQRRTAWIFAAGWFVTVAPIVYVNILISRNSWHGRWLFPSIAPIMIACVFGFRSWLAAAEQRPRRMAIWLVGVGVVLEGLWLTSAGEAIREWIRGNHYGDQGHLIATVGDAIIAIAIAGVLVELTALISRRVGRMRIGPAGVAALAWAANLVLLVVYVWPLYEPLDARGFATIVREEVADREYGKAGLLYRIGLAAYPASTELRQVAAEQPLVLMGGGDDDLVSVLQSRIARGETLSNRAELLTLARLVRTKGWLEPAVLRQVLDSNAKIAIDQAERAEPLALIRAELDLRTMDPAAGAAIITVGGGRVLHSDAHGEATIEGYTVNRLQSGFNEVVVYFRPLRSWGGHRVWIHAYPGSAPDNYLALDPAPPGFGGWNKGELSWETFQIPASGQYRVYAGIAIGEELGPAVNLGVF